MPIKKTDSEIAGEIILLKGMRDKVRDRNFFGEDNRLAIDAQIAVLEKRMSHDQIYREYGESDDDRYILSSALVAMEWMAGDLSEEESPSEGWSATLEAA